MQNIFFLSLGVAESQLRAQAGPGGLGGAVAGGVAAPASCRGRGRGRLPGGARRIRRHGAAVLSSAIAIAVP